MSFLKKKFDLLTSNLQLRWWTHHIHTWLLFIRSSGDTIYFSKLLEQNGERKNLLLPKKRRGCCADVAARLPWWINRCFKYRGKGVQRERFCYPRIGSVCFKNQLLTLTNKLLQSKLQHRVSVSLVEVFVVLISPHMCRMWMKVALSFPSHLLKTMAKCMWQNYLFQFAAAKTKTKTGTKNICGT